MEAKFRVPREDKFFFVSSARLLPRYGELKESLEKEETVEIFIL